MTLRSIIGKCWESKRGRARRRLSWHTIRWHRSITLIRRKERLQRSSRRFRMRTRCSVTRASEGSGKPLAVAIEGTMILAGSEAVKVTALMTTRTMDSAIDKTPTTTEADGMETKSKIIKDNNHNSNSGSNSRTLMNFRGRRRSSSGTSSRNLNRRAPKDHHGKKWALTVKTHYRNSFAS